MDRVTETVSGGSCWHCFLMQLSLLCFWSINLNKRPVMLNVWWGEILMMCLTAIYFLRRHPEYDWRDVHLLFVSKGVCAKESGGGGGITLCMMACCTYDCTGLFPTLIKIWNQGISMKINLPLVSALHLSRSQCEHFTFIKVDVRLTIRWLHTSSVVLNHINTTCSYAIHLRGTEG